MDFIGLKAVAAREIALAFGVPPMLLGLPGDATHSNYHEANRALWRQTVLPLAGKIVAAVTQGLARWYPGATLAVDLDRVTELASDREMLWKMVDAAGFLTLAEKREMVGLEDPAADVVVGAQPAPAAPDPATPEVKYNPNHDPATGEFSSGPGGGGALPNLAAGISSVTAASGVTGDRAGNASLTILPPLPKPYDPFAPPGATSDPFTENQRLVPTSVIDPTAPQPPGNRHVSQAGIDLIAEQEGFKPHPYVPLGDKSGITIGYGYDIGSRTAANIVTDLKAAGVDYQTAVSLADGRAMYEKDAHQFIDRYALSITITKEQAKALLPLTATSHATTIDRLVKVPLNQNQFDALVSLSYNHPFTAKSDIIQLLNQRKYSEAADRFGDINKVTIKNKAGHSVKVVSKGLVRRRAAERQHFLGK